MLLRFRGASWDSFIMTVNRRTRGHFFKPVLPRCNLEIFPSNLEKEIFPCKSNPKMELIV